MSIFKLGEKILSLLEAVFGFWNNQIALVFDLLGTTPDKFNNGGPWAIIESINPIFVAVGSSLVVLFFVIGFCSESVDIKEEIALPEKSIQRGHFHIWIHHHIVIFLMCQKLCGHFCNRCNMEIHLWQSLHQFLQLFNIFCIGTNQCLCP